MSWIVFDLDGTLIESEGVWADVRREFVETHGGRWHAGAQTPMIGMRTGEWAHYMHDDLGVPLAEAAIARGVVAGVSARIRERVPILPGANEALARLGAAFVLGLATSASRPVADAALAAAGWERAFRVVVSADEVARGKPAPDVYLRALQLLRADPQRSVAVEDSTNGIRSGHAAGLPVIAIPNREYRPDPQALALAARVLPDLDALDVATVRSALGRVDQL